MASAAPPPDYLVVGHLSLDRTSSGPTLGGTAAYAALTARALGRHPAILTSAADDLDLAPLHGISLHRVPADESTTFHNVYSEAGRQQQLLARARDLEVASIPVAWRTAAIVHLAPIAAEMPPSLVHHFPESSLVGLTPQGWMRQWDDQGRVTCRSWRSAAEAMGTAAVVIIGAEDVGGEEAELEALAASSRLLIVTEGSQGSRVYWNGDVRRFPAPAVDEVDPTGAGDIFAASFLVRYDQTRDPWEAARFANLLAAASVTRRGLAGVPTADEVRQAGMVWTR